MLQAGCYVETSETVDGVDECWFCEAALVAHALESKVPMKLQIIIEYITLTMLVL